MKAANGCVLDPLCPPIRPLFIYIALPQNFKNLFVDILFDVFATSCLTSFLEQGEREREMIHVSTPTTQDSVWQTENTQ